MDQRVKTLLCSQRMLAALCDLPREGVESTAIWEGAVEARTKLQKMGQGRDNVDS